MKGKAGVAPFLKKNGPSSVDMDGVGPFTFEMAPVFAVVHPVSFPFNISGVAAGS